MQIRYLHKPGNKFQDKSQMQKESPFWLFFWYVSLHSFLFAKWKSYQDKKIGLEMMSQAIPGSLNFGKSSCCLSPECGVLHSSGSGQLALASENKEGASPCDSRNNPKDSETFLSWSILPESGGAYPKQNNQSKNRWKPLQEMVRTALKLAGRH